MPLVIAVVLATALFVPSALAVEPECYEIQAITAVPGKLDALHAWLRDHRDDVLAKHGAECLAFLVPAGENPGRKVLFVYRLPSLVERLEFMRRLKADPSWKQASDGPDACVEKVDSVCLRPTYYSPDFTPTKTAQPRVFELRTYTCPSPESLAHLHYRFRDHTMGLFAKHGMENLIYWNSRDIDDANRKLVYLLGHKSVDAAQASFAAFRKDPDWLAAREEGRRVADGEGRRSAVGVLCGNRLFAVEVRGLRATSEEWARGLRRQSPPQSGSTTSVRQAFPDLSYESQRGESWEMAGENWSGRLWVRWCLLWTSVRGISLKVG